MWVEKEIWKSSFRSSVHLLCDNDSENESAWDWQTVSIFALKTLLYHVELRGEVKAKKIEWWKNVIFFCQQVVCEYVWLSFICNLYFYLSACCLLSEPISDKKSPLTFWFLSPLETLWIRCTKCEDTWTTTNLAHPRHPTASKGSEIFQHTRVVSLALKSRNFMRTKTVA
jgi:hypothetical protein